MPRTSWLADELMAKYLEVYKMTRPVVVVVVSLFDESGNMGRPWAERGASVFCFDILNKNLHE